MFHEVLVDQEILIVPELGGRLEGLDEYAGDGVILGAADLWLRSRLTSGEGHDLRPLRPTDDDVGLALAAMDCYILRPPPCLAGVMEAFVFAGDLEKWLRHGSPGLDGIHLVAGLMADGLERHQLDFDHEGYVQLQSAVWAAQLLRTVGPRALVGDIAQEPRQLLSTAIGQLGFGGAAAWLTH